MKQDDKQIAKILGESPTAVAKFRYDRDLPPNGIRGRPRKYPKEEKMKILVKDSKDIEVKDSKDIETNPLIDDPHFFTPERKKMLNKFFTDLHIIDDITKPKANGTIDFLRFANVWREVTEGGD